MGVEPLRYNPGSRKGNHRVGAPKNKKTDMDDAQNILVNADDISLDQAADAQPRFCQLWPGAKQGLEALREIIKNPIAKAAIGIAIAAGDAVSGQICGGGNG